MHPLKSGAFHGALLRQQLHSFRFADKDEAAGAAPVELPDYFRRRLAK
jgi:hypothetical protein